MLVNASKDYTLTGSGSIDGAASLTKSGTGTWTLAGTNVLNGATEVRGGTLVFYRNRTFTDQVTGWMGGLKQEVGRSEMLTDIAANLRRVREQLKK